MKKILRIIIVLTLLGYHAEGQNPVRYLQPVFEKVTLSEDIEFGEVTTFDGKTEKLLLDVYSPEGDTEMNRPVILLLHGGGFRPGNDKKQSYIVKFANDFAKRGYVCISINYRVRTAPKEDKKGTMADALEDAMSGLNWIRDNHQKLNIDKKKIIIGGGSAGGMLAVNFCYKDNSAKEKWDKSGIKGLINLWGSPDQTYMFANIDKNDPPTIIVHGTADKLVPYENSVHLAEQLKTNQIKHELVTIEEGEHTPVKFYSEFAEKIAAFIFNLHANP
jgi:acetyl esterase/lipase